ncbi:Wzz/FepE/Etk N-terminal domain-containing protein [Staphylococcus kloosii]|jgi:capsular polysaccharide biosynthesis protein|uniref:Capsular polysaccharide type 5 biosynthesis protein cap5A n=1 Tax=Staphylococcus kloosii TaxID=29384 RepID=A0ABQ0XI76_9STAP|nr:Wzz/FepE/Etk N-terminal domain-containing protein [Staphylococcus kloosii]AVQ35862.1 capsule biosynthesis protein CapA [Staphylococcus kloosii]MBF7021753.1 capsule biosynthesis protein CapA [Staphylococcus kloosii]MCD8878976.1 capsule biosynthesis protein CapA [Staphylococcus kloosii]PNZ04305.1 capsule biosynthesis protein CapA [Staphylococcus kloosii]PTJ75611.1 capsule biosynthesis protein CapA [Staphylococcus kloosii]
MNSTLNLLEIRKIVRKNIVLLITVPLIFLFISIVITNYFIDDKYVAKTQLLVYEKKTQPLNFNNKVQEIQSNLQLVNTYSEIIKSPRILDKVAKDSNIIYEADALAKMLTVTNQTDTQILNIAIQSKNAKEAERIANNVAKTFQKEIPKIMDVNNVSILSNANNSAVQVSPKLLINATIGFTSGAVLTIIMIVIRHLTDKRIKNETDVKENLDIPVLGLIQKYD